MAKYIGFLLLLRRSRGALGKFSRRIDFKVKSKNLNMEESRPGF